jgi:tight adherence protein B
MTILQIVVLFFIASLLVVVTLYMWYAAVTTSPKYVLRRRLRRLAVDAADRRFPEELRIEILREMTPIDRLLFKLKPFRRLDVLIDRAGLKVDLKVFIMIMLLSAALAFALGMLSGRGLAPPLILLPVGVAAPLFYLRAKKNSRIQRFTEQFPDALDMISRSLKAGHSFAAAIHLVGKEMSEPISGLFKTAHEEQTLGVSTREAIAHMAERVDSMDLRFFVMAINIHREVGGNLGEILERLAKTIRERITIRRQVRVYTAQARLSGYILAVVPVAMAFFFYFSSPGYIEELFVVEVGRYAIALAIAAQIAGFLAIRSIVNIRI